MTYYFKYGLTLVALGMLQEHRRGQSRAPHNGKAGGKHAEADQEEEGGDGTDHLAKINAACVGIAAVIVPVIQRLSQGPVPVLAEE